MRLLPMLIAALPAASSAQTMQPGQWEIVSTVTAIKGPGVPPNMAAMMKRRPTVIRHCVTPAEAAAGPRDMMKASPDCRFDRFSMSGGHYASHMRCTRGGTAMTVDASGSYTPVSMASTATMVMSGRMGMSMTSSVKGRRLGACRQE